MYLKSLELHGFKSFPNRTVLTFDRGSTVIVGPNGSGKSNISDAMRWVLGESNSRNIRGAKLEDVIFGGTDDRRPMGFAEVSVTFDNTDPVCRLDSEFDEVRVTRRYYRTGESEYLINRENKRLRDIQLLFMNTGVGRDGYSIIGQGKVADIISKKSDDRRTIFEEAAGISKYRHSKEDAEKKLKGVSENLERINDIKTEIEAQVSSLERDAEKARRGLEVYERKKRADVSLWLYDTEKIRLDIEKAEADYLLAKNNYEIILQLISDLEARYNSIYEKSQEGKLKSAELLEDIRITREARHELDAKIKSADSDFAHSLELIEECRKAILRLRENESAVLSNKSVRDEEKSVAEARLAELMDQRFDILASYQDLSNSIADIQTSLEDELLALTSEENEATDLLVRINVIKNALLSDGDKSVALQEEIERLEKIGVELRLNAERADEAASEFKVKIEEKDAVIEASSTKIDDLTEEKTELVELSNKCRLERDSASGRADDLQRMVDHFDGYQESVKFVMREYAQGRINSGEIYGPLSSLISVDKQYITAIETALGGSLQNIVVDNEGTAKAAIRALKNANAGRATFYPITAIRASSENDEIRTAKKCEGFVGRADTLVDVDDKYRVVVEFLLLRTLVFDNIDNASIAAKKINYRVKIVTLDGQVINAGGSFTGGSAKRDSGILTRTSEIAALREKTEALTAKLEEYKAAISEIDEEIRAEKEVLNSAEMDRELLLTLSRTQFAELDNANAKLDANRELVSKFKSDYEGVIAHQGNAEVELHELQLDHEAALARMEVIKSKRLQLNEKLEELQASLKEVGDKLNDKNIELAEERKEIERIDALISTINDRLDEIHNDIAMQEARIEELKQKQVDMDSTKLRASDEFEALAARLNALEEERRSVESGNDEYEGTLNELRQKEKENSASRQAMFEALVRSESKLNELKENQVKLGSKLWEDYEITYEEAVALQYPPVTAENHEEMVHEQTSLKNKLRSIGSFDPESIEKYAEVKTRYDYLTTQYNDLVKSQEELVGIISRIEVEMQNSFIKAFNSINKHFGITFKELFGGGNAELSLTEPDDVLTSGIEIKAAPPGKIIKSMSLLSGGEQTFVAIALLFAILKVNPTPFCILDEIEAALDEVNVYRFGEYVKKLEEDTQFILITHRRGTMEIGDRLYGVTMPQNGISQAIELNVGEIETKQKELLDGVL